MQPDNMHDTDEKVEQIPLPNLPPEPPAVTPLPFGDTFQSEPNKKRSLILHVIIVVVFISIGAGVAVFKAQDKPKAKNIVTGEHRSLFAYIDGANDIQQADFELSADPTKEYSALPFLSAQGKVIRDKNTNELHAQVLVDKNLVKGKISELKDLIDYENREYQADYNISDSYELDMAGLLSKLSILPAPVKDESFAQIENCQELTETYDNIVRDELNTLQPNYQRVNEQETKWEIDFAGTTERLTKQVDDIFKACFGDSSYSNAEDVKSGKLTLTTIKNDSNVEFKVTLEDSTYSDRSRDFVILTATLSNIKTKADKAMVVTGPSVFSIDNTSEFIVAVNRCKSLPFIAGGGLFGSYDYVSPESSFYEGPSLLDTGYFCSAKEAEAAGYKSDAMR